jgi:hypothetical protein
VSERYGATIIFKAGVTEEQIAKAMNALKDVLDIPSEIEEPIRQTRAEGYKGPGAAKIIGYKKVPFTWRHLVQKFDDQYGGPVWYIP